MRILILLLMVLLSGCKQEASEPKESNLTFTVDDSVDHKILLVADLVCRDRIELNYSDMILSAKEIAFDKFLKSTTAYEFLNDHCYAKLLEVFEND